MQSIAGLVKDEGGSPLHFFSKLVVFNFSSQPDKTRIVFPYSDTIG
jgi:hypothetical protein